MLHFLFFAVLAAVVWRKAVPRSNFVELFATLLEHPERIPRGAFDFLRGIESVGGEYEKRPVTLVLHYKRGNHRLGYLTLGVATRSPETLRIESRDAAAGLEAILELFTISAATGENSKLAVQTSNAVWATAWLERPAVKKAVEALISHGLSLALEGGWLRARWMPIGLFVFPGRFDAEKWREVLAHMKTLALALDDGAATRGLVPAAFSPRGAAPLPA